MSVRLTDKGWVLGNVLCGAMAQAVICHPIRAEAQVQTQTSLHNIFGGQICTGSVFSLALRFFTISIAPSKFSILILLIGYH